MTSEEQTRKQTMTVTCACALASFPSVHRLLEDIGQAADFLWWRISPAACFLQRRDPFLGAQWSGKLCAYASELAHLFMSPLTFMPWFCHLEFALLYLRFLGLKGFPRLRAYAWVVD